MLVKSQSKGRVKQSRGRLQRKREIYSWIFVIVPTIFILLFYFYPMIQALWLSLHSGVGVNLDFVGL